MRYGELADLIKTDIDRGIYIKTGKLPTEEKLMEKYGVTRYCVRHAVDILVGAGRIIPIQGSGMFVRENTHHNCIDIDVTRDLYEEFKNRETTTKIVIFQLTAADLQLAEKMECKVGTSVYHIKLQRIVDDEYLYIEESYYNKDFVTEITPEFAEKSLYNYIKNELGVNVGFSDKMIYCEKLNKENSELLMLNKDDPALVLESSSFLSNGQKFAFSKKYFNYKIAKLFHLSSIK